MKKLLLLSALCVFAQVRTEENKFPEMTIDEQKNKIKILQELLESVTYQEIENDVKSIIDPVSDKLKSLGDQESLSLKSGKLGHGCQEIMITLNRHHYISSNLNPAEKEELESLLPLCANFFSNIKKAITNSSLISSEKDHLFNGCTELENKAMELMQNK